MAGKLAILEKERLARLQSILVVGDLHGDADSLARTLKFFRPDRDVLIFLGDYSDRGENSVEVPERINQLLLKYPANVIALQGNHEQYSSEGEPQFSPVSSYRRSG